MPVTYPCQLAQTFAGLSETKLFMGLSDTTEHDEVLQDLLEEVTSDFQNYMDRYIFVNDWEEKFDIETKEELCIQLKEFPVVSVAGLTDSSLELTSDDYLIYPEIGHIRLDGYYFTKGPQSVEISYRAGYLPECVPAKLRGACKKAVQRRFNEIGEGNLSYEKIGDYAYRKASLEDTAKWRTYGWPSDIRRVLDYFRDTG